MANEIRSSHAESKDTFPDIRLNIVPTLKNSVATTSAHQSIKSSSGRWKRFTGRKRSASDAAPGQKSLNQSLSSLNSISLNEFKRAFTGSHGKQGIPRCDLCDLNSSPISQAFCVNCNDFLCKSCYEIHTKRPECRQHKCVHGSKMPKSKDFKPVKYEKCADHGKATDQFCTEHRIMICQKCTKGTHKECRVVAIHILSESISSDDVQHFKDLVFEMKATVESEKVSLDDTISVMESNRNDIIKEIEDLRDKAIQYIKNSSDSLVSKVTNKCQDRVADIENHILDLTDMIDTLDRTIYEIEKAAVNEVGPNKFIKLLRSLTKCTECKSKFEENKFRHKADYSFVASEGFSTFLNNCKHIGKIVEVVVKAETVEPMPDIIFPQVIKKETTESTVERQANDTEKLTARKLKSIIVKKEQDDDAASSIAGFDETCSQGVLVADKANRKIKLITHSSQILSSIPLASNPIAVSVVSKTIAVVSTNDNSLLFIDISDPTAIMIEKSISLPYCISNMMPYQGKLGIVVESGKSPAIKIIDYTGNEVLSVTNTQKRTLFGFKIDEKMKGPCSIVPKCFEGKRAFLVSDWKRNKINLLDGSSGHIIGTINEDAKAPNSLATDFSGNVFVSYRDMREICVWTTDLQDCYSLLHSSELQCIPHHIIYNNTTYELLVSYENSDLIDIFQIL